MTASAGPTAVWQIGQVAPSACGSASGRGHDRPGRRAPPARPCTAGSGPPGRRSTRATGPGRRTDTRRRLAWTCDPPLLSIGSSIPGFRAIGNHPRMQDARRSALPATRPYQAVDASPTARATGAPYRGTAFQAVSAGHEREPVSMSAPRPARHRPVRPGPPVGRSESGWKSRPTSGQPDAHPLAVGDPRQPTSRAPRTNTPIPARPELVGPVPRSIDPHKPSRAGRRLGRDGRRAGRSGSGRPASGRRRRADRRSGRRSSRRSERSTRPAGLDRLQFFAGAI